MEVGSPLTMDWFILTLDYEANWPHLYTFSIDSLRLRKVRLLLLRDGDLASSHGGLHYLVSVAEGWGGQTSKV